MVTSNFKTLTPFATVTPILPHEIEIWKEVSIKLKEENILERANELPEDLRIRFIRGSESVKKKNKMLTKIVKDIKNMLEFQDKFKAKNILSSKQEHLKELKNWLPLKFTHKTIAFKPANLNNFEVNMAQKHSKDYSFKNNRAVIFADITSSNTDTAKVFTSKTFQAHLAYLLAILRLKKQYSWKSSSRIILILDLSSLTLKQYHALYKSGAGKALTTFSIYPEALDRVYLLNPPKIFSWIFRVVKTFLDPVTVQKIRLVSGESDIKAAFDKEGIDINKLPISFSGVEAKKIIFEEVLDDEIVKYSKSDSSDEKSMEKLIQIVQDGCLLSKVN